MDPDTYGFHAYLEEAYPTVLATGLLYESAIAKDDFDAAADLLLANPDKIRLYQDLHEVWEASRQSAPTDGKTTP